MAVLLLDSEGIRDELAVAWERGVRAWAWWKDGEQFVGTCGTTLKAALLTNPYRFHPKINLSEVEDFNARSK